MFELDARPHPPRSLYRSHLEQSAAVRYSRPSKAILTMLREPSYRAAAAALGVRIRPEVSSGSPVAELENLPRLTAPTV